MVHKKSICKKIMVRGKLLSINYILKYEEESVEDGLSPKYISDNLLRFFKRIWNGVFVILKILNMMM